MSETQRTPERIRHHFEVEHELALRMRSSTREERTQLFKILYNELFERVPDHPRLTRRDTAEASQRKVDSQIRLLLPFLKPDTVFLEIAPGDCRLLRAAAGKSAKAIGVDISDQRAADDVFPANLDLVVYDGYNLDLPANCADVAFSYQFLEHLHPEDVDLHFAMIRRLLKPGGVYVFDTPHRYSGPHDVSRYFGTELKCFHFQEWTYRDMRRLLKRHGFTKTSVVRFGKPQFSWAFNAFNDTVEAVVGLLPAGLRRKVSLKLFQSVTLAAQ